MLDAEDWARVAAAPVQPHLGDFMIGTPAGLENTQRALAVGITHDRQPRPALRVRAARRVRRRGADGHHRGGDRCDGGERWARALLPRRRSRHAVQPLRRLPGLGGAGAAHRRGPARRAARALLRRPGAEPGAPRDRRARAGPPTRRRLARLDGLRQHGRVRAGAPAQPRRARDLGDDRRRHAAAPADRTRDQPGAAERGRADPGRGRDPRGAPDGARARDRGARGAPLLDWAWAERRAAEAVAYARAFRDGALAHFADAGADPGDAAALLLCAAAHHAGALERRSASPPRASCWSWRPGSRASSPRSPSARGAASRGWTAGGSCSPRWRSTTWSATRWRGNCRRRARR